MLLQPPSVHNRVQNSLCYFVVGVGFGLLEGFTTCFCCTLSSRLESARQRGFDPSPCPCRGGRLLFFATWPLLTGRRVGDGRSEPESTLLCQFGLRLRRILYPESQQWGLPDDPAPPWWWEPSNNLGPGYFLPLSRSKLLYLFPSDTRCS